MNSVISAQTAARHTRNPIREYDEDFHTAENNSDDSDCDEAAQDEEEVEKLIEMLVGSFIQSFLQHDALNVMRQWCKYGPGNAPSPPLCSAAHSLLPHQRYNDRPPSPSSSEPTVRLLEIFVFAPFHFSVQGDYIEFFQDAPTLRIMKNLLCKESSGFLDLMDKYNEDGDFFKARVVVPFQTPLLTGFTKNNLFEKYLDRLAIVKVFIWIIMQFDIVSPKDGTDMRMDIAGYLYLSIELFFARHLSQHYKSSACVRELFKIQKLLKFESDIDRLYSYLLHSFKGQPGSQ